MIHRTTRQLGLWEYTDLKDIISIFISIQICEKIYINRFCSLLYFYLLKDLFYNIEAQIYFLKGLLLSGLQPIILQCNRFSAAHCHFCFGLNYSSCFSNANVLLLLSLLESKLKLYVRHLISSIRTMLVGYCN